MIYKPSLIRLINELRAKHHAPNLWATVPEAQAAKLRASNLANHNATGPGLRIFAELYGAPDHEANYTAAVGARLDPDTSDHRQALDLWIACPVTLSILTDHRAAHIGTAEHTTKDGQAWHVVIVSTSRELPHSTRPQRPNLTSPRPNLPTAHPLEQTAHERNPTHLLG